MSSPALHSEHHSGQRSSSHSGGSQQLSAGSGSDGTNDGEGSSSNPSSHNDNSSSDSADAASAASTWPHAVATRRCSHLKDGTSKGGEMAAGPPPPPTTIVTRIGSSAENESHSVSHSNYGFLSNGPKLAQRRHSGERSNEGAAVLDPFAVRVATARVCESISADGNSATDSHSDAPWAAGIENSIARNAAAASLPAQGIVSWQGDRVRSV